MIRSMTGYGDAERDSTAGRLRLEVKTVNHRFFNANIKTPSGFDRFEKAIADALRGHLTRGHVSAYLTIDRSSATPYDGSSAQRSTRRRAAPRRMLTRGRDASGPLAASRIP